MSPCITEKPWYRAVRGAHNEMISKCNKAMSSLFLTEWANLVANSKIPIVTISRDLHWDQFVPDPTAKDGESNDILFAPKYAFKSDGTFDPELVNACARLRRIVTTKQYADIDEMMIPARAAWLEDTIIAAVRDIVKEATAAALASQEAYTVVSTLPDIFINVEGYALTMFVYALCGTLPTPPETMKEIV